MAVIINSNSENPYRHSLVYQKKTVEKNIQVDGVNYSKKITYEKKLSSIYHLGIRIAALLATILPCFFSPDKVIRWRKQASTGIDQKIVLIAVRTERNNRRQEEIGKSPTPENMNSLENKAKSNNDTPLLNTNNMESKKEKKNPAQKDIARVQKKVHFGDVRGRIFDNKEAAVDIKNMGSIELDHINTSPAKIVTLQSTESKNVVDDSLIQKRQTPPTGMMDTVRFSWSDDGKMITKSAHGEGELFSDDEIVEKLDLVEKRSIGSKIYVGYTKHKKAILLQQATRGCTAATAAMLILDNGKVPDIKELRLRNLGNTEDQIRDIQNAGLTPLVSSAKTLPELRELIKKNGSTIVGVDGELGGHVVVVDEISADLSRVRLRDPYHGWEITVKSEAFLKEWKGGETIQVK